MDILVFCSTTEFAILRARPKVPSALEDLNSTLSKEIMANTSLLLDSLLSEENYDRRIRPGFGGERDIFRTR